MSGGHSCLTLALGLAVLCGCGPDEVRLRVAPPAAIRQAQELGQFRALSAALTITHGDGSSGADEQLPDDMPLTLDANGSFVSEPITLRVGGWYAATVSYRDEGWSEELRILDQTLTFTVGGDGPQTVALDEQASRNTVADHDYDNNDNGVSNFGEIVKGWDPIAPARRWLWQLPVAPTTSSLAAVRLTLLPNGFLLVMAGNSFLASDPPSIAIVDAAQGVVIDTFKGTFVAIDDARQQIVAYTCDSTGSTSRCYLTRRSFDGTMQSSVEVGVLNDGLTMMALAVDGTAWLQRRCGGERCLTRVTVGGDVHHFVVTNLFGSPDSFCLRGPGIENHWVVGSTLFAIRLNGDNCIAMGEDTDLDLAAITLPTGADVTPAPTLAARTQLVKVGSDEGTRVAVTADGAGGDALIYATSTYKLTATRYVAATQSFASEWASEVMTPSNESCSGLFGVQSNRSNVPLASGDGQVLAFLAGCDLYAFPVAPTVQPQAPIWSLPVGRPGQSGLSLTRRRPGDHLGVAGGFIDDPGAARAAQGQGPGTAAAVVVGGLALDVASTTASVPLDRITGFYAQVPQNLPGQGIGHFMPQSDVVATADGMYFVILVTEATPGLPELTCSDGPPCYVLVAGHNTPVAP